MEITLVTKIRPANTPPTTAQVSTTPPAAQPAATAAAPTQTEEQYSRSFDVGREISVTHQPVGRLLQAAGVPARQRPAVPVVATADRVLWVAGHRASADALADPGEPAVNLLVVPA